MRGFCVATMLLLATTSRATPASTDTLFGPFPAAGDSVYAFNVAFTTWMLEGVQAVQTSLQQRMKNPRLNPGDLELLRKAAAADAARISAPLGPSLELARQIERATRQKPELERIVLSAPDANARQLAEQNIENLRREILILERARAQVAIQAQRMEELATAAESWTNFWALTESAKGPAPTRMQVTELLAKEAARWDAVYRREVAEALLARNFSIPEGLPPSLQGAFRVMVAQLPRFKDDLRITPNPIQPLFDAAATNGVAIIATTTRTTAPKLFIAEPGGTSRTLEMEPLSVNRYRAIWHPPFLKERGWLKKAASGGRQDLGVWNFRIELKSDATQTGVELVTASTTLSVRALAEAPLGIALQPTPKKSKFLRQYPDEEDVPLDNKHHLLSILSYPILGLPRDLVDAAFGTVDKIPYVAIPINLVYAGPGQLLCKPWWDEEYLPFSQQSAGYYSWTSKDNDDWQYFENLRTWYWPKSEDGGLLSFVFYLGLGLPRDVLDAPFGVIDQIPVISTPISHVYAPLTLATKPWYAERYTGGEMKGKARVPYCEQSKSVVCTGDWWDQSRWVFFENFKTTTFRSPNVEKQARLAARHRKEMSAYTESVRQVEEANNKIRSACVITLGPPEATAASATPVRR
mgnify:CR=1 FL=1